MYSGTTPIEIDDRVIERYFGEFEGLTRAEFDFNGFWNINANPSFKNCRKYRRCSSKVFFVA